MMDKQSRFLIIDGKFSEPLHGLLIVDFSWWYVNDHEIIRWCDECLDKEYNRKGVVLTFKTIEDRLQFILRWGQ